MKEYQEAYDQGQITLPSELNKCDTERIFIGLAEDKTIARMMEMLLTPTENFDKLFNRMTDRPKPTERDYEWINFEYHTVFPKFYNAPQTFKLIKKYPEFTHQILNVYSQTLGYEINPINDCFKQKPENEITNSIRQPDIQIVRIPDSSNTSKQISHNCSSGKTSR